jgi:hypothetical protein
MIELSNIIALTKQDALVYFQEQDLLSSLGIDALLNSQQTNPQLIPLLTDYRDHFSLAKRISLPRVLRNPEARRQDTCYMFHYNLQEGQMARNIRRLGEKIPAESSEPSIESEEYLDWFLKKFPSPACLKIHTRLNTTIVSTQENSARVMHYLKQAPEQMFEFLDGIMEEPVSIVAGRFELPRVQIHDFVSKPYQVKTK